MPMNDKHDRPDTDAMKTALGLARVILDSADLNTAHEAAEAGTSCPACVAVAAMSYGITLASTMAGDQGFTSEPVRLALLDAVDATEAGLRSAPN